MMKRVSEAEEACLNLTWSEIPKTHFRMAWLILTLSRNWYNIIILNLDEWIRI